MRHNFIGFVGMQVFEVLWFVCVWRKETSFWMNLKPLRGFSLWETKGSPLKHIKPKVVFLTLSKV
jgi:hypothetical protein